MKNLFKNFKKSKWIDLGVYHNSKKDNGKFKLIQMRYRLHDNKKEFRSINVGYFNIYSIEGIEEKNRIINNILTNNSFNTRKPD